MGIRRKPLTKIELFAGCGGGILGGMLAGQRTVCAVEIEPACRERLIQRQVDGALAPFPIWDDVTTFDGRPWRGRVDIVAGGFPCQDISVAGKGAGIEGERSGLWSEMARVVREVGPRFVFVENSPALTFRGLGVVLRDLAEMGFNAKWGVLGGFHVGNICNGERLWIVAFTSDCTVLEGVDFSEFVVPGSEESCRRQYTGAVGAMLSQDDYSRVKRDPDAVAAQMDRLKAIGNGQVPAVAATAWQVLTKNYGIIY